jgi:hypothetical protein
MPQDVFAPMKYDLPPIQRPVMLHASDVNLQDGHIVIGVLVNAEARAYLRDAFEVVVRRHVVLDSVQSRSIAVTHCDRSRCTRVLASPRPNEPLDVRVGGWRSDQTLALLVQGKEYSQKSSEIPLDEIPFTETTWRIWRKQHPDTLVYVGRSLD